MMIATTTQMMAAPKTSDSVAGAAATIWGQPTWPWFEYDTRSRVMKSFFIMMTYRTGTGLSRPNWCLISVSACGDGFRPAIWRAGSTPGVSKKIRKTSTVMANITSSIQSRRRMMKGTISSPMRSFARGSRASRIPSPSTFSERTVRTIMIPGAIATHGRV